MNYLSEFLRNSGSQYPIQDGGEFRPDLAEEFAKMKAAGWFDEGNGTDPSEQGNLQNALLGHPDQNSRAMQRQPQPDNPQQSMPINGGTVSTLNGWGAQAQKEKAALDAMFQGALAGGDIEKAARLAVTPQQQALLSVAYGQRANDQDRRARQESGLPVGPPTDLMKNYNDAQYTNVMRSQAEQDRRAKMAMMGAQFANVNERTAASQQARNQREGLPGFGIPQSVLEKQFGKAPEGMVWTPQGKAVAIEGGKTDLNAKSVLASGQTALDNIDEMIGKRDANGKMIPGAKPHPGFESAVGVSIPKALGAGFLPGTDTSDFNARLDQVRGGAFMQAYEGLKGTGQITEIEGKKATDAITRMQTAQSEAEFVKAATEFKGVISRGMQRAQGQAAPGGVRKYNQATGRIE